MNWKFWKTSYYSTATDNSRAMGYLRILLGVIALYFIVAAIVGIWWSRAPSEFDVRANAAAYASDMGVEVVPGFTITAALHRVASTLLDKPGGHLSNDLFPPGLWLDNMPNWEFGVLTQVRDMGRAMRIDFSRSQSQSAEDKDLQSAEVLFFIDNTSWLFPRAEDEYRKGTRRLKSYLGRLADDRDADGQFYSRADNLQKWLEGVESRLGNLSQQLSASVGKRQLDTALAGDPSAELSTTRPDEESVETPWLLLDDYFFEARGQTWALIHLLRAIQVDFKNVLEDKNAMVSLRQVVRELEGTQSPIRSPMILNGTGMGFLANHSLVMASYISRANAGITDLRELLSRG